MALPDLDQDGWLPDGIFDTDLEELRERFGFFKPTDRRPWLCEKWFCYVEELRAI